MKDDRLYVSHMLDCIKKIEAYTAPGYAAYAEDTMMQDAVMRNLEIMGEAAKQVSAVTREQFPDVPGRRIASLRDVLIHDYMGVDIDEVWNVIVNHLPDLKGQLHAVLEDRDD